MGRRGRGWVERRGRGWVGSRERGLAESRERVGGREKVGGREEECGGIPRMGEWGWGVLWWRGAESLHFVFLSH